MGFFANVLRAAAYALFFLPVAALPSEAVSTPALGSKVFRPTLQRPFGWRGDGSGRYPDATPVTEWSATKNVRWSAVVGASYSSPILTDKVIVVASEPNRLSCLDRADGKVRWNVAVTPALLSNEKSRAAATAYEPPKDGSGIAAATPITDGKNVYGALANGIVFAVDLDGHSKWFSYIDAPRNTSYGRSSSPIIVAGKLIVSMTNLYAFDPITGKQLWVNTDALSSYGTPTGLNVGGVDVIVTPKGDVVRLSDGKSLNDKVGAAQYTSPVADGGIIYFAEGTISAVRLNAAFKDKEVWNAECAEETFGSPLIDGDTLLLTTAAGELFSFDIHAKGLVEPIINSRHLLDDDDSKGPRAYASLTLAGKYIFLTTNRGDGIVMEATREAKLVSKNTLPRGSGASPIFSGGDMFLRAGDLIYCIGK